MSELPRSVIYQSQLERERKQREAGGNVAGELNHGQGLLELRHVRYHRPPRKT